MSPPRIDSFQFGRIVIDGKSYTKDVIILPDEVRSNWWRKQGHNLIKEDLEAVFAPSPDVLVVGQGTFNRVKIDPQTKIALERAGIELIALSSKEAWKKYNKLRGGRKTAAAIHLTC